MTQADLEYIKKVLDAGLIKSPCLEMGVGYGGLNSKDLILKKGIEYYGTDLYSNKNVDFVIDFESSAENIKECIGNIREFSSILVLNVLEHTYNPIKILDNVFNILKNDGTCVIITPIVWSLHSYPKDFWRINLDFYEEYSLRNNLAIIEDYFEYISIGKLKHFKDCSNSYFLPPPTNNQFKLFISKIVHKLFNTFGRGMFFPSHLAIGLVVKKSQSI